MDMEKTRNAALTIAGIVLAVYILSRTLGLLNAVLYRAGGLGVLIAVLALVYVLVRKAR